ncbi:MAG: serine/threonine protein kinase, partial [Sandaracinaceae bacterium]|nr:serine/threonine protein kinase [Sandaracinaceae bacterium]
MGQSSAATSRIGSTIAGKYRLLRLAGEGAIGTVYAAVHQFTGKNVAVKLLDSRYAAHEGYAARFLREARAAAAIGHPAICDVLDAGQEPDGTLYLIFELLEGRTLGDAIEAGELSTDDIVTCGIQLLEGLAAAHDRGIVHRDIKPDNVFLTWSDKGELRIKLLDFGVAKHTKGDPELFSTQQGAILGTPYYMSPEQAHGDEVDHRADLWSTGAVLFHALTGRPPFDETTYNRLIAKLLHKDPPRLRTLRPDLPEWLATAVDGALVRDVADRWQSARTMAASLRQRGRAPLALDWEVHEDAT